MEEKPDDERKFHFDKLNVVVFSEIYKYLTMKDVFELSFTSKSIRERVQESSFPVKSIAISFNSILPTIILKANNGSTFAWNFGCSQGFNRNDAELYKIGIYNYRCEKSHNGFHTDHHDIEHGMLAVIKYLVSIFNFSNSIIEELSIDLGVIKDCRAVCQQFTKFRSIERLSVYESYHDDDSILGFGLNFDWIMSNLVVKEMYVGVEILEQRLCQRRGVFDIRAVPMRLEHMLRLDHIGIKHAGWITSDDFSKLDFKTAILIESSLTEQDLNTFIKKWLNSTSNKLCWLEVRAYGEVFQRDAITADLNLQQDIYRTQNICCSCPYRRFESLKCEPFYFPLNSKQITRADGSTASISINNDTFFFHVKNDGPITPPRPPRIPRQRMQVREVNDDANVPIQMLRVLRRRRDENVLQIFGDVINDDDENEEWDNNNFRRLLQEF